MSNVLPAHRTRQNWHREVWRRSRSPGSDVLLSIQVTAKTTSPPSMIMTSPAQTIGTNINSTPRRRQTKEALIKLGRRQTRKQTKIEPSITITQKARAYRMKILGWSSMCRVCHKAIISQVVVEVMVKTGLIQHWIYQTAAGQDITVSEIRLEVLPHRALIPRS